MNWFHMIFSLLIKKIYSREVQHMPQEKDINMLFCINTQSTRFWFCLNLGALHLGDNPCSNGGADISQHEAAQFFVVLVQL